jgi:metal iron transporter
MNCPSRTETSSSYHEGYNQSPPALAADLTTREDLNGRVNLREFNTKGTDDVDERVEKDRIDIALNGPADDMLRKIVSTGEKKRENVKERETKRYEQNDGKVTFPASKRILDTLGGCSLKMGRIMKKFSKFIGPGFMVAVAYIDPGK